MNAFAMYASMSDFRFPQLFAWAIPLFGGDFAIRRRHDLATWFFILFTVVHVCLRFYRDFVEGHGVMSSMVGGWKFLPRDGAAPAQPAASSGPAAGAHPSP